MSVNKQEKKEDKVDESPISLRLWDNKGEVKKFKSYSFGLISVAARGRISAYSSIFTLRFFKHSLLLHRDKEETSKYLKEIGKWFNGEIENILYGNFDFFQHLQFFRITSITTVTMTYVIYLFIKYVTEKSEIQRSLSSVGLNQYYLKKMDKSTLTYTFKLHKGEIMDYKTFEDSSGNLKQLFGYDQRKCERLNKREIKVMFNHKFPSQEDLKSLNVKDFQKEDYIFLGIGLPKIGEEIKEEDRVLGKYVRKYLKYESLPQGIGNFGGSGFGKSNTLNQIFQSIFKNFNKVQSFTFCDFKQGIERQPYADLEKRIKTGRIHTMDDDRLLLLNYLLKVEIMIKARGKWLKKNGKKKIIGKDIILFFDEMAEILDYEPRDKVEKQIQDFIYSKIESLLRIGRRAGLKLGYSTQSPLQNASGLSNGMKNNTPFRLTHGLASSIRVSSVYEDFESRGVNPLNYDIGKLAIVNMTDSSVDERRALYVPDDFLNEVEVREYVPDDFDEEIKEYYELVINEEKKKKEIMNRNNDDNDDDEIFTKEELLEELLNDVLVNYNMYDDGSREKVEYSSENRVIRKKTKEELEFEKQFFDNSRNEDKTEDDIQREKELLEEIENINLVEEPEVKEKEINIKKEEVNSIQINSEELEKEINLEDYENIDFDKKEEDFEKLENMLSENLNNMKKTMQENYNKNIENKKNGIFEAVTIDNKLLEEYQSVSENEDLKLLDEL